jgi:hypothetical protein
MGWKKARLRVKIYGREVTSDTFKHVFNYLKGYLKDNWGAPFIAIFILLLIVAAIYLAMDLEPLAKNVAVYAYYSLVVAVALQYACLLKCKIKLN